MASPLEVLANAQGLLEDYGVSRGAYARDQFGEIVSTHSKNAETFCVIGAVARSCRDMNGNCDSLTDVLALLLPFMDEDRVIAWNDDATDEEILSVIKAAANAERTRLADRIGKAAA